MRKIDTIRAWKDPEYRESLTAKERATLADNPAGMIELTEVELETVGGGVTEIGSGRIGHCSGCCRTK